MPAKPGVRIVGFTTLLRSLRKRCARCENFSRQGRNDKATLATIPHNHKVPGINNNLVPI